MTILKGESSKAQGDERAAHSHPNASDDLGFQVGSLLLRSQRFLPLVPERGFFWSTGLVYLMLSMDFLFPLCLILPQP